MNIESLRAQRRVRIEIVPLIDIMFFLLATFVMVSLSMTKSKGIPVNLPQAVTGENKDKNIFTTISITMDGRYFIDSMEVMPNLLAEEFKKIKNANSDPKIYIKSDTEVQFGKAVNILDELRNAGISKIAIETKTKESNL